ncbi:alkaline phosphatase family protein [Chenggangzhangella methanolivorans]|uniref:alkaline phosphatase family protein n=2 Tax=Chenggangzhangella methanolivorans TaxID=1437009 RepID=UPI00360BAB57
MNWSPKSVTRLSILAAAGVLAGPAFAEPAEKPAKAPKVVLISLDGARPDFIQKYLKSGVLPADGGIARLVAAGAVAERNVTANPSLTAVSHIAIATGSTAVHNDVPANSFHPVAAPIGTSISGFGAPIGGYEISPTGPAGEPTAEPLWVKLRKAGKSVVAATWPGADGATVSINGQVAQAAEPTRVVDYTVPFGAFAGISTAGFSLGAAAFSADKEVAEAVKAAGKTSYSKVLATDVVDTFSCASELPATCTTSTPALDVGYRIRVAALDSTDDGVTNYDTLVFFDANAGVISDDAKAPSTGSAFARAGGASAKFYLEGSGAKAGLSFFAASVAPDLANVRFIRYSAYYIPRNAPALAAVDDINHKVGFWAPQPDFRIPERLSAGLDAFSDAELEAAYQDQVTTFVAYQGEVATRAIKKNPGADLAMIYFEEPDGSKHQFLLTDRRQASDPRDPNTIGKGQDQEKVKRYADYVAAAYQRADEAVAKILDLTGPETNVLLVSDHGFAPFHTAANLTNILRNAKVDVSKLAIRTSGPAANVYVNLKGRENGGTVSKKEYRALVDQVADVLRKARDPNGRFNGDLKKGRLFSNVRVRPDDCGEPGFCVDKHIGQDFGDVFAQLDVGYNFDGQQTPPVKRKGDKAADAATVELSTPNFYGAHGHDADLPEMAATFIAAGPGIRSGSVEAVRNIDVAPTVMRLLGVTPAATVDGKALNKVLK